MRWSSACLLVFALCSVACSGRMGRVVHAYEEARLPEAVAGFRALEADARDWPEDERARYALYRGLAHLGVGDLHAALVWLSAARAAVDRDEDSLSRVDRARLDAAWRSVGLMPGQRVALQSR